MSKTELIKLRKQLELINETVSSDIYNLGDKFFEQIVIKLNQALDSDYTFIGELNNAETGIETISLVNKKGVMANFNYQLKDTPCENVIGQNPCSYSKNITKLFPKDQLLIDMGIEAYVGVPLYDSKSHPTGILVCLFENKIKDIFATESILMIFASRAGAELEHKKLYNSLEKNKQELELKVTERTKELKIKNVELEATNKELELAIQRLQNTQTQLVQSEKMASLGILTAGVAHEINNPLNYILGGYTGLKNYFEEANPDHDEQVTILLNSINVGVERAAQIVNSLNQFSRAKESFDEVCNIHSIIDDCLIMLNNRMDNRIEVTKNYSPSNNCVTGNIGKLHQAFLNILSNSIQSIEQHGEILINTKNTEDKFTIKISDSGYGISKEILTKIIDPFFTTKQPGEGIGLGLTITYSIIEEHKGSLEFESVENKGTTVIITLPQ